MAAKRAKKKRKKITRPVKPARTMALKEFLDNVHTHALAQADAGMRTGACLVTDPQTGQSTCVLTDQVTCTKGLGGRFIGGPCG